MRTEYVKALEALENASMALCNDNYVEQGWELRGIADALRGDLDAEDARDENYGRHYRLGWDAVSKTLAAGSLDPGGETLAR